MPSRVIDSEHWRSRAKEMRMLAEYMTGPEAKETVFRIAADYDEFARRAELGDHLRERAEEMRTIGEYATDQQAKDTMLRIAVQYDELARRPG